MPRSEVDLARPAKVAAAIDRGVRRCGALQATDSGRNKSLDDRGWGAPAIAGMLVEREWMASFD